MSRSLLPESVLWSYVIQLTGALRAVHAAGLACRTLGPSKVLLTGRNRLRVSFCAVTEVLTFDVNNANNHAVINHHQVSLSSCSLGRSMDEIYCIFSTVFHLLLYSFPHKHNLLLWTYTSSAGSVLDTSSWQRVRTDSKSRYFCCARNGLWQSFFVLSVDIHVAGQFILLAGSTSLGCSRQRQHCDQDHALLL